MNRLSPTFCVMPHLGLAIQNDGDMCVCNLNSQSYELDGLAQTIDKITVDQIWSSPTRTSIANMLDTGIKNPGCNVCWDAEAAGKQSTRQLLNEAFGDIEPDPNQPRILILKPGNTCNAACRICFPTTSSSWYKDAYELEKVKDPTLKFNSYIKKFESVKNSFNLDSPNMWPILKDWYKKLKFIDIYGGEPFLIPGLWLSLQEAIDNGYAKGIDLRISTNGSIWNEDYMHILSQFKTVDIGVSIDSHVEREFEYMRHKLNYKITIDHTKKIIAFTNQFEHMLTRISCTVSVLNIWNLNEIYSNLNEELSTTIIVTNFVYMPDHYDIRHLPREVKALIIEKLKHNLEFLPVINFMDQIIEGCVMYWPKFCMTTDKLDKVRGTNFKDVYTEWYSVLEPFWDYKKPNPSWYGSCGFSS